MTTQHRTIEGAAEPPGTPPGQASKLSQSKKPAKKAASKKAASKKASGKKAAKKKPAKRREYRSSSDQPLYDNPDVQVAVWQGFWQTCTITGAAKHAGVGEWVARQVVMADREKMIAMIHELMQWYVGQWEQLLGRSLGLLDLLMDQCEAYLIEIREATKEGRKTSILNDKGEPMPVVSAVEWFIQSHLLKQLLAIASEGQRVAMQYRLGNAGMEHARGSAGHGSLSQSNQDDLLHKLRTLKSHGREIGEIGEKLLAQQTPTEERAESQLNQGGSR